MKNLRYLSSDESGDNSVEIHADSAESARALLEELRAVVEATEGLLP